MNSSDRLVIFYQVKMIEKMHFYRRMLATAALLFFPAYVRLPTVPIARTLYTDSEEKAAVNGAYLTV